MSTSAQTPPGSIITRACTVPQAHGYQVSPPGMPVRCDTPSHWPQVLPDPVHTCGIPCAAWNDTETCARENCSHPACHACASGMTDDGAESVFRLTDAASRTPGW